MAVKASSQISIADITDSYSVFMDNESFTFNADNSGNVSGSTAANITAICGTDRVNVSVTQANIKFYEQGSSTPISSPKFSASVSNSGTQTVTVTITAGTGAVLTTPIDAVIPISVDGVIEVTKRLTLSAAKTGTPGQNGSNGAKWYQGSGAPSSGTGANGDYYLNTSNGDVYTKSSGSWSQTGNIKGATGSNGQDGADGSKWSSGTALSGTSGSITGFAGEVNDQYLNSSNGNTYKCVTAGTSSTAVWNYTGNIKGAAGQNGTNGADAIVVEIESDGPLIFKKNTDYVTLTPKVKVGTTYKTLTAGSSGATCDLGTIKWYKGSTDVTTTVTSGVIEAQKSGSNFTGAIKVYGAAVDSMELFSCKVEG